MDIIATLCATLTTSEAGPVDLLSNAPQQIKGDGIEPVDCCFLFFFPEISLDIRVDDEVRGTKCAADC